jgi:hypothetical protein
MRSDKISRKDWLYFGLFILLWLLWSGEPLGLESLVLPFKGNP